MAIPNPTKTREWKDGNTPATGTPALGSYFNAEFDQLYANDNYLDANKLDKSGGVITGNLTINGDLAVQGDNVVINVTEVQVEDKIITLNNGEVGPGVTGNGISGIEIDRGSGQDKARLVFDESDDSFKAGLGANIAQIITRTAFETRLGLQFFNVFQRIRKNGSNNEVIVPPFRVILNSKEYFTIDNTILGIAHLDTGSSWTFGSDYYIWAGEPQSGDAPVLKISLSQTSPQGMTNPRIIGGFHYGKIRNSITISDVSNGIVPNSCWDLNHMPRCYLLGLEDPENYQIGGMVEVVKGSLWVDIYLASNGGGSGFNKRVQSKINQLPLTGTDGLNWYDFAIRGRNSGKRMLTYAEWVAAAIGSPQGRNDSNLHGWTKTSNTGRVKTAATNQSDADADYILGYNTSLHNVRDCVGNVWEWLNELSNRQDSTSWNWYNVLDTGEMAADTDFGQAYMPNNMGLVAYLAGGAWDLGVCAGSRAVYVPDVPWVVNSRVGCRFACESL